MGAITARGIVGARRGRGLCYVQLVSYETLASIGIVLAWMLRELVPMMRRRAQQALPPQRGLTVSSRSLPPKGAELDELRNEVHELAKRVESLSARVDPIARWVEKQMGIS